MKGVKAHAKLQAAYGKVEFSVGTWRRMVLSERNGKINLNSYGRD